MKLPISIIIIAYNEENYLPILLKSIKSQTVEPKEVIVVDANSHDRTSDIVEQSGYRLLKDTSSNGPAHSRNVGAEAATEKILLFLDADVALTPDFLEKTLHEMVNRRLDIASCLVKPMSSSTIDQIMHTITNNYINFTKSFFPHAPGFCIFIYKQIHEQIGGFNENLALAEDHDYVQRASKFGKFSYLYSEKILVSVRRLKEDGRFAFAMKYLTIELHLLFFGKIKQNIFEYKFGKHSK